MASFKLAWKLALKRHHGKQKPKLKRKWIVDVFGHPEKLMDRDRDRDRDQSRGRDRDRMRECDRDRDRRAKSAAPGDMAKDKKAKRSPKSAKKDKKGKRDDKTLYEAELKELQVAAVQERNRAKQNVERIKEKMQQYRSRAKTANQ